MVSASLKSECSTKTNPKPGGSCASVAACAPPPHHQHHQDKQTCLGMKNAIDMQLTSLPIKVFEALARRYVEYESNVCTHLSHLGETSKDKWASKGHLDRASLQNSLEYFTGNA